MGLSEALSQIERELLAVQCSIYMSDAKDVLRVYNAFLSVLNNMPAAASLTVATFVKNGNR